MAVLESTVTDAQVALAAKLAPPGAGLSDDELRTLLATTTAMVVQRDPVTGEALMASYGPLTTETVDPYQLLGDLWEQEGMRLAALAEQPRRVTSESTGDESRSYDGGGPMTSQQAFALARRMRRRALAVPDGARTVSVLPPYTQRGYDADGLLAREPQFTDGQPVPAGAPYQVNRPELRQ